MHRPPVPGAPPSDEASLHARLAVLEQENAALRRQASRAAVLWPALETCLEGLMVHRDGVVLYANQALARLFGYASEDEVIGLPVWETFPEASYLPMLRERAERLRDGQQLPLSLPWAGRRQGGGRVMIRSLAARVEWEGRPAVLSIYLDVSGLVAAEEALAANERRFRKLIENARDGFTLHAADTSLLYESAGGYRIMGYDQGSNIGVRTLERIHPEDAAQARQVHEALLRRPDEPVLGVQFRVLHADGTYRWLEFDARNLLADPDVGGILVNWRDVTERRAAEEAMRQHLAFREVLIRTAGEGICVCSATEVPPYVTFSIWNDRMTELTGYTMAEINALGWHPTMYPDPEVRARAVERMASMRAGDDLRQEEWTITRKDGQRRTLAISTSRVETDDGAAVVALMSDVTARREAEAALREGEERLRLALEAAGMISYAVNLPGSDPVGSADLAAFFGMPVPTAPTRAEEYLGLVHPDDRERVRAEMQRVIRAGGETRLELRTAAPAADGGEAWYITRARLAPASGDRPARLYGVTTDITGHKRDEVERRRLEEKVHQAQHLESLGVLAGGIAHDFNNLLTTVLGYASLGREQLPPASPVGDYLGQIEQAARRAADLCQQMLAYAGKGAFAPGPVDLAEAVRETAGQMRAPLPPKARLTLQLGEALPPIHGDGAQVRQVLVNLLSNAAEALGDDGGAIGVTARREALSLAQLRHLTRGEDLPEGEYVCLEVSDTGRGMDAATRARIFEPFFTTKFTGRGLGLSAVLGIVRGHGGAVEVTSAPGEGSTFRVYFPAARGPVLVPVAPAASVPAEGLVLVAEDEPSIRRLAERLLTDLGLAVRTAADGREALDLIAAAPGQFRLALLDLTMPEVDGAAVATSLLTLAPDVPVVLMSGYSVAEVGERLGAANVVGLLQKPFTKAQLVEVVSRALAR